LAEPFHRCEYCFRAERAQDGVCRHCGFDGVPRNEAKSLPEGTPVGGRYVLGHQEGSGGFSICYRAWDSESSEIVAVKELFPSEVAERLNDGRVGVDPQYQDDFDTAVDSLCHEGEVLRQLNREPGIVRVGDVFQDNDTAYLPMEFLRGQSYQQYLDHQYARNHAHLDVKVAINVALTILGALDAVHARRLLHLDLKPANIRVLDDGRIVLLDFGSAREAFRQGAADYGKTFTPGYAALEQHDPSGSVTAMTDIHALAATLYYSLSLRVPTRADAREMGAPLVALSELNPDVPQGLDFVIQKAMALDPDDRYPTVSALRTALAPFGTPSGLTVRQLGLSTQIAAPASVRFVAGLVDLMIVLLLLAALTAGQLIPSEQILVTGLLLWWLVQLLPLITGATPGMLAMSLRLTDQSGGANKLWAMLLRTVMLLVSIVTFRFRSDSEGLLMHDRVSGSRVVMHPRND
jgi:uncharacterized RDD family membrane protein YckC